jgi:hypothetical protein
VLLRFVATLARVVVLVVIAALLVGKAAVFPDIGLA